MKRNMKPGLLQRGPVSEEYVQHYFRERWRILFRMGILFFLFWLTAVAAWAQQIPTAKITVESKTVAPATKTTIRVTVESLPDPGLASIQGQFRYDPKVLSVTDVQFPQILGGSNVIAVNRQTAGLVRFAATLYGANLKGIKSGVLLEFAVEAVGKPGDKSDLTLVTEVLSDVDYKLLTAEITNGVFEIEGVNVYPVADFIFTPAQPAAGQTVQFTDKSTDPDGKVVAWAWDFGDGVQSSQQNPTHIYQTAGTFKVRLTVTDDRGAQSTAAAEKTITVGPPTELKVEIINYPNPAKGRTKFTYSWLLPGPAKEATLKIFNLKGELVFSKGLSINNKNEFTYDLKGDSGRPLSNGPYFYFLTVIAQDGRSFRSAVNVLAIQR